MNSSGLIDRKYFSLYVGNLSLNIRRKELCQYLEQFDFVDRCQLFEINHHRLNRFAFVLMRTPDGINRLMANRPHFLDNRRLNLKRALSEQSTNKIEHFLTSASVIIQLKDCPMKQADFTEENIRNYFQTYGTILHLTLLENNRCVIEYNDYDAVDCIILDSPHYFNSNEIQSEKYYSNEHIQQLERMLLSNSKQSLSTIAGGGDEEEHVDFSTRSYRHLNLKIRLLTDSIASVRTSNEIQLETIEKGFQSTINRRKILLEKIQELNEQCQRIHQQNQSLKQINRIRMEENEQLENKYRNKLIEEENQQMIWKQKFDLFQS